MLKYIPFKDLNNRWGFMLIKLISDIYYFNKVTVIVKFQILSCV